MVVEWIQGDGVSDEDFQKAKDMAKSIKSKKETEAAKRWQAAEDSDRVVRIEVNNTKLNDASPGNDENWDYQEAYDSAMGTGGDAYIRFDPNDVDSLSDGSPGSPEATLAHEMGHAYLMIEGRNPIEEKSRELDGTAIDNQYRDNIGVGQRRIYGKGQPRYNWNVPQYRNGQFRIYGTGEEYQLREVR